MPKRALTLISYDIADNQRRARVFETVKAFGLDGQKSVHECTLSPKERLEIEVRLRAAMDLKVDRLMILLLDPRGSMRAITGACLAAAPNHFYAG